MAKPVRKPSDAAVPTGKRLFRYPFAFGSQLFTSGDGTQENSGAVGAGVTAPFPLDPFLNALSRPFIVKRIKVSITRVGGGDEVDSDYANVSLLVTDLVRNEDLTKDPIACDGLLDKERREWIFHPGELILRALGGGVQFRVQVQEGAIGAPYNITVAVHGYTEELAEAPESMYPEER
jgi:hypothetical protein